MGWGTPLERFWDKVESHVEGECWPWIGGRKAAGYGQFMVDGHKVIAHRWAYATFVAPIPAGFDVDHVCQHSWCVNPSHLEAITHQENVARRVAAKTHCIHGHEYTPENTWWQTSKGYRSRVCRACQLPKMRAANKARRAAKASSGPQPRT